MVLAEQILLVSAWYLEKILKNLQSRVETNYNMKEMAIVKGSETFNITFVGDMFLVIGGTLLGTSLLM